MNYIPKGNYPEAFYRVSVKAIIRNGQNEVLLVKEKGSGWSLPGGGMDHGETAEEAIARELLEEVSIRQPFSLRCIGTNPRFVKDRRAWLLWVVHEVTFSSPPVVSKGPDADEVAYVNPKSFYGSSIVSEQLVYKWCVDKNYHVSAW